MLEILHEVIKIGSKPIKMENHMIDDATLGERIHKLRSSRGWTIEKLAEKAEISKGFLSLIENGRRRPGSGALNRICEALETSPSLIQDPSVDIDKIAKIVDILGDLSKLNDDNLNLVHQMVKGLHHQ